MMSRQTDESIYIEATVMSKVIIIQILTIVFHRRHIECCPTIWVTRLERSIAERTKNQFT